MTAYTPKVSVIMNCLNGEKFLRAAIESVYAQTYANWEIILLDNASTDRTGEVARSFDSKLRYFRNETTVPLGQARNLALQQTQGDLIAFLDCDDEWLPAKLMKQVPLFENAPRLGLVFGDTVLRYQVDGRSTTYFAEHGYYPPQGKIFSALLENYSIPMLTVVIRREVLDGLDEWFDAEFCCCDDYDFFMRVAHDWDCAYVSEPLATCFIHNEAATVRHHRYAAKEKLKTLDKLLAHNPAIESQFGTELARAREQIVYGQGKSYWRDGENAAAREVFRSHWDNPRFLAAYFATFLPYTLAESLTRRLWR